MIRVLSQIRQDFFYQLIYRIFISDLGSEDEKKKKKSSENDQLTGHFQSFYKFFLISSDQSVKLVK